MKIQLIVSLEVPKESTWATGNLPAFPVGLAGEVGVLAIGEMAIKILEDGFARLSGTSPAVRVVGNVIVLEMRKPV